MAKQTARAKKPVISKQTTAKSAKYYSCAIFRVLTRSRTLDFAMVNDLPKGLNSSLRHRKGWRLSRRLESASTGRTMTTSRSSSRQQMMRTRIRCVVLYFQCHRAATAEALSILRHPQAWQWHIGASVMAVALLRVRERLTMTIWRVP